MIPSYDKIWYQPINAYSGKCNTNRSYLIQVKPDQTGVETGWMSGQMNGAEGIFPEAYVQFQEDITVTSPEAQQQSVTSPSWVEILTCSDLLESNIIYSSETYEIVTHYPKNCHIGKMSYFTEMKQHL